MSEFVLPATAGSIVSFTAPEFRDEDYAEDYQEMYGHPAPKPELRRYAVTLVPSKYDPETGKFLDSVWMDMYAEAGGVFNVSENVILAGKPKVMFEAPEPTVELSGSFDIEEVQRYGTIALLDNDELGKNTVVVFAPGVVHRETEKVISSAWVNPNCKNKYLRLAGIEFSQDAVAEQVTTLLVRGTTEAI